MKKALPWIIAIVVIVIILLIIFLKRGNSPDTDYNSKTTTAPTSQEAPSPAAPSFTSYHSDSGKYSLEYPTGFTYDVAADQFVNKAVTKEGQPAFFKISMSTNAKKLTIDQWWDTADRQKIVSDAALKQEYIEPVDVRTIGEKTVVVASPKDLGSTTYLFASGDKIVRINAFSVDAIDHVVQSFAFTK